MAIVPVAKSLYSCEEYVIDEGKVDLYGLFNAIRSVDGYPYSRSRFCVFAQLVNGLGDVSFYVDIRSAKSNRSIYTTVIRTLTFPSRTALVQVVVGIEGIRFPKAGLYLFELYCNNSWVADVPLLLH